MSNFSEFLVLKGLQSVTVFGHTRGIDRIIRKMGTSHISKEEASRFVVNLYLSDCSYSHKANSVTSLEYWMEYCGRPMHFSRQRKPKRLLKDTLTEAEVTRIIYSSKSVKETAISVLLAYSGLRPKELCKVRIGDIDFGTNQLRVEQGKGLKDDIIYLPSKCVHALMRYHSETKPSERFLFETYQGNPYNQNALRKLIKVMSRRAGVTKRVYPYLLRHSLATNMIKRGANLLFIKEHFRHAWLETTMLYIHSIGMQERQEQFFPQYV